MALYDRLLASAPLPEDVKRAFEHNRMASLDHHKPAFERCAGVATGRTDEGVGGPGHECGGCGHGQCAGCGHGHGGRGHAHCRGGGGAATR